MGGVSSVSLPGLLGVGPLITLREVEVGPGPAEKSHLKVCTALCSAPCWCSEYRCVSLLHAISCVQLCVLLRALLGVSLA